MAADAPPRPPALASLVVIVAWLIPELQLAWTQRGENDSAEEMPSVYPDRGSDFVLEAALAQLGTLDAQANVLDEKLGHVAAVSGALLALLPALVLAPAPGTDASNSAWDSEQRSQGSASA